MRRFTIGLSILILASLAIINEATANKAIQQTFPYSAHVLENGSYVRSGPGKAYYPTERLQTGDTVEVYRHDPGGWLAIRPTKKSFTWVRARYLKPLGDGLAEVTGAKVAARMGSRLDDAKDVVQVRLNKGETVELIDTKTLDVGEREPWIKIRPPSGEFRWIHSSLVDLTSTAAGIRQTRRAQAPIVPRSTRQTTIERNASPRYQKQNRRQTQPQPRTTTQYNNTPMHFAHDQRPQSNYARAKQNNIRPAQAGWDFEESLAGLELELSEMVASDPKTWSFNRIAMDAESLAGYSQTAVERGRIREVLSKIDRFEELQDRKTRLDQMIAQHERLNHRLAMRTSKTNKQTTPDPTPAQIAIASLDKRFDGTGTLRRVKPVSKGAPNYALIDDSGTIRCYVTPAPDVPFNYYENRRIGVTGNRGYMPHQRIHHVMAKRVQLLR